MKRSPLQRSKPLQRRTRIKWRPTGTLPLLTREALRERANGRCERCRRRDYEVRCDAHHRKLKSQGGTDDLQNLLYLCRSCHHWAHTHRDVARTEGWIIDSKS